MLDTAMTWTEIIKAYPNRWVVLRDVVMDGPNILSGIVAAVKSDDEICDYESEHLRDGLIFRRTTEENWSGIVESNLVIEVD